ncbi:MAG: GNAT family N-acetyltransferase [Pseudothermotoga sp.]
MEIVKGKIEYVENFIDLVIMTGERFLAATFGKNFRKMLEILYQSSGNLFSHECSVFAVENDVVLGLAHGYSYDYAKKWRLRTGKLILQQTGLFKLASLLKIDRILGKHSPGEFYLSNLAVYPQYRKMGIGKLLLEEIFKIALENRCDRIVLDVESENHVARNLYHKLGFEDEHESQLQISKAQFCFIRMARKMT